MQIALLCVWQRFTQNSTTTSQWHDEARHASFLIWAPNYCNSASTQPRFITMEQSRLCDCTIQQPKGSRSCKKWIVSCGGKLLFVRSSCLWKRCFIFTVRALSLTSRSFVIWPVLWVSTCRHTGTPKQEYERLEIWWHRETPSFFSYTQMCFLVASSCLTDVLYMYACYICNNLFHFSMCGARGYQRIQKVEYMWER